MREAPSWIDLPKPRKNALDSLIKTLRDSGYLVEMISFRTLRIVDNEGETFVIVGQ